MDNIETRLKEVQETIKEGNNLGEKITLVGATKFVSIENINKALSCGLTDIGENWAQEFRDKYPSVLPCNYHFIGYIQKNKLKYIVGKASLIESCDRLEIIEEINKMSLIKNITSDILLEINIGEEENKHGFKASEVGDALKKCEELKNIRILGLMSMLPDLDDKNEIGLLTDKLRQIYDTFKDIYGFKYLSCGISGDYKTTIKHGSNMIRIGSYIFGKRY